MPAERGTPSEPRTAPEPATSAEAVPAAEAGTRAEAGTPVEAASPARKSRHTRARKTAAEAPEPATAPAAPERAGRRRILVTGASGFVGRQIAQLLLDRGDHVVAPVRDAKRVGDLADSGAEVIQDDHTDVGRLAALLHDVDGAIHAAGAYRVGIRKEERGAMWDANVGVTTRFLDAAEAARTPRIVYVSTVNVFGNTRGRIVDETYRRNLADGFLSWYDETKYGAHEVAEQRIRSRAPIVIVMPSQVYGPRDHSGFGAQLRDANRGKLRYRAVDDLGVGLIHVEDLAAGIVAALDRGVVGQSYVLSGPTTTLREALEIAAGVGGRRPPRLRVPTRLLRAMVPVGSVIGQPNLREVLSASAGVTYWATSAKAEQELGFRPRDIETGFGDTFGRA